MKRSARAVGGIAAALMIGSVGAAAQTDGPRDASHSGLPDGWRWESFRDVQLGVPATWESQVAGPWGCVAGSGGEAGVVERPSHVINLAHCSAAVDAGGRFVAFEARLPDQAISPRTVDDRTTVATDAAVVLVQAEESLRKEILATLHAITVDTFGCRSHDPVATDPDIAPHPAIPVEELRGVVSVTACRYYLDDFNIPSATTSLQAALPLTGDAAVRVIEGIVAARLVKSRDATAGCTRSRFGTEAMVLRVMSERGESRIHMFYTGCNSGIRDGYTVRRLDRDVVQALIAGPNRPTLYYGDKINNDVLN